MEQWTCSVELRAAARPVGWTMDENISARKLRKCVSCVCFQQRKATETVFCTINSSSYAEVFNIHNCVLFCVLFMSSTCGKELLIFVHTQSDNVDHSGKYVCVCVCVCACPWHSSLGTGTRYELDGRGLNSGGGEIFRTRPDWPCGPTNLIYKGYLVTTGGQTVREWRQPAPKLNKEQIYTSTPILGLHGLF